MPDGGAGRPHRGLRRLRPRPHAPTTPAATGIARSARAGARRVARGPAGRAAAGAVLPRRLHAAGAGGRDRLPEQGRRSTPSCSAPRPRRCAPSPPTRSISAPRSASSPCSTPGARTCTIIRMSIASCPAAARSPRRHALGRLPPRLLPAGARALAPLPAAVPRRAARRLRGRRARLLRRSRRARRTRQLRPPPPRLRRVEWVVYAKPPFGGPEQVLAYLGRYTHRVAIANSRLVS